MLTIGIRQVQVVKIFNVLTIGIFSGATCSGKTTVAAMLEKCLPWCTVVNQVFYCVLIMVLMI